MTRSWPIELPSAPRRVLPQADGMLVLDLEEGVMQLRPFAEVLEPRCRPQSPGEMLLWAAGEDRCVLLAEEGRLALYAGDERLETVPGVLTPDDEPVDVRPRPDGGAVLLVGRMVGPALGLATPQYRFVRVTGELRADGADGPVLSRRPLAWGADPAGARVLMLTGDAEKTLLTAVDLIEGTTRTVSLPAELAGQRITGMSIDPDHGLAVTVEGAGRSMLGLIQAGSRYRALAAAREGERFANPLWAPDGARLAYTLEQGDRAALLLTDLQSAEHEALLPLPDGAEAAWQDAATLVVVSWNVLERVRVTP